jgi:hypothetical protein
MACSDIRSIRILVVHYICLMPMVMFMLVCTIGKCIGAALKFRWPATPLAMIP